MKKECKRCISGAEPNCYMKTILEVCQNNLKGVKNINNTDCETEIRTNTLEWKRCRRAPKKLYQYTFENWIDEKTGKPKIGYYCKLHYKEYVIWEFERGWI